MTALLAHDERDYLSDRELRERYLENRRMATRYQAEAAADLAEIDRRTAYQPEYLSATAFVRHEEQVSGGVAHRLVGEARGLAEHPHIREAFEAADLDRPRVSMLLAAASTSPETFARDERMLVNTISGLGMRDARKAIEYWKQAASVEAAVEEEDRLHERRSLHLSRTMEGMFRLDGYLDPESGEVVTRTLQTLVEPGLLDPDDTRTNPQRRADALTDLCADHLAHGETPTSGGVKPHVTLNVAPEALRGEPGEPCELTDTVVTPITAQRIACDATVTEVTVDRGEVLDVGRARRTVPAAIRSALETRDRGCTWNGCDRPVRWCDAHHIVHWAQGGPTSLDNLRLLCRRHHRAIHLGVVRRE